MASSSLWQRFQQYLLNYEQPAFSIDISRMKFPDDFFDALRGKIDKAFSAMGELEAGAIANPDEQRMVGHYWLRNAALAPNAQIRGDIEETNKRIKQFAADIHSAKITAASGEKFEHLLLIGIGGSALGPQFIADALGSSGDAMNIYFLDNTDPDGFDRVFGKIDNGAGGSRATKTGKPERVDEPGGESINHLSHTLVIVVSKSGGTKETRNGMLETEAKFKAAGIPFGKHAVAVTGVGSELDKYAEKNGWLARFPMFDWIGGRTSVMSAVGLVPMALQGYKIDNFLSGAAAMDERTRVADARQNAAMLLALMWHYAGNGRGEKDMVVLPYKDRLMLFSKYLQQLVMESLGKEKDLDGNVVRQGIAVYGNKGSTDQHAYLQQLRDGVLNFFVTFIEVRQDRHGEKLEVDRGVTSGDYLQGFMRGTRAALYESGRESITVSIPTVDEFNVGALIALYERAVGFYGFLVNINAYHQPGVEAGKKAATKLLELQGKVRAQLSGSGKTAEEIAHALDADPEDVFHTLSHLAANDAKIDILKAEQAGDVKFSMRAN
ncbi:MAG: glucose-6-phosphate isomerase [Spartobacteria bacterium]